MSKVGADLKGRDMRQAIGLVTVLVGDYDEALAFYRGRLGFTLVEDSPLPDGKRWVVVRPPGTSGTGLLLAQAADEGQRAGIGRQAHGRVFLFLETDDFARDHRAFEAAGVLFHGAPRYEPYGIVAVFKYGFGNLWDLIERRDSVSQLGVQAP